MESEVGGLRSRLADAQVVLDRQGKRGMWQDRLRSQGTGLGMQKGQEGNQ